jgi:hypothetical protein
MSLNKLLALAVVGAGIWGGCVVEDPNYCDETKACPAGRQCNLAFRGCEPIAVDGGTPALDSAPPVVVDAQLPQAPTLDLAQRKSNGATCASGIECASGSCTAGVCCGSACSGACESCTLPGQVGTCSPRPAGTACGVVSCVDEPTASYIAMLRCTGTSSACQTVKLSCGAYTCTPGEATCRTSCQANSDCSSALCDLLDAKSTCVPSTTICHTSAAVTGGDGGQTAPLASIGQCLASGKAYVAVADGVYNENLSISGKKVHIYALAPQPSVYGGGTPTVKLRPNQTAEGIVALAGSELYLRGIDLTSAVSGPNLLLVSASKATVESCYLHDVDGAAAGLVGVNSSTITLVSSRIERMGNHGLYAADTDVTVQRARINNVTTGLRFSSSTASYKLQLTDVEASQNRGDGIHIVGAYQPWLTNVIAQQNGAASTSQGVGFGLFLKGSVGTSITNLLVTGNRYGLHWEGDACSGACLSSTMTNATIAYNSDLQLESGLSGAPLSVKNSIIWATAGTVVGGSRCSFTYSDVAFGQVGTGNIDLAPLFMNSGSDFHLQMQGSPCINAGDPGASGLVSTDLDGKPRVVGIVDMGAYEVQ